MRFSELQIETRRERPARAHTDGEAMLIRAGFLDGNGQPTGFAQLVIERLPSVAPAIDGWRGLLGLSTIRTSDGITMADLPVGDFRILHCANCGYAATPEAAEIRKATAAPESPLPIDRVHTPGCRTIESLAEYVHVPRAKTAKAILYWRSGPGQVVFVVIRGDMQLSEHKLFRVTGPLELATDAQVREAGAEPGYASPVGLRKAFIIVDDSVSASPNLVAGANVPDFHLLNTNVGRDYIADAVADLALAQSGDPCLRCGSELLPRRGIMLADDKGINYVGALQAIAEQNRDDQGLMWPSAVSPFDVHLLHVPSTNLDVSALAAKLYDELTAAGLRVLFDDRDERAGVKFKDADLIGCPLRVTVGERHLGSGMVEFKRRVGISSSLIPIETIAASLRSEVLIPE